MPAAGEVIEAWHGARIATTTATSSTSAFTTTETVTDSVTASLVSGERYLVEFFGAFQSTVAGDNVTVFMREDSVSGTQMYGWNKDLLAANVAEVMYLRAEYTAASTASKTFVVTGNRTAGSGNVIRAAVSTSPTVLSVTHIKAV